MTDLTCDELDALLPEFLDGTVTDDQRDAALAHLATCDACTVVITEMRGVGALFRQHGRLQLPDAARARIRAQLEASERDRRP